MCEQQKLLSSEVLKKVKELNMTYNLISNDCISFDKIIKNVNKELENIYLPSHIDFKQKKFTFNYIKDKENKSLTFTLKYNNNTNNIYISNDLTTREKYNIIENYTYNDFILLLNDLIYIYVCELIQDYKNTFLSQDYNLFQYSKGLNNIYKYL